MRSSAAWARVPVALLALLALLAPAGCDRADTRHREFFALGTVISVDAWGVSPERFDAAADAVERHLQTMGIEWYPRAAGELRRLNTALAAGGGMPVSPALQALLRRAAAFESRSGGRFNACLGALSGLWGFYDLPATGARLPDPDALAALVLAAPACGDLRIDGAGNVSSSNPLVAVDLGGIAKGALLDDARDILRSHGIADAIVNLGGDLLVTGRVEGRDARIGIRAADGGPPIAGLEARPGEAVFTSGTYERFLEIDGRRYAHVLDPGTGRPVDHTVSVTVVHTDPVLADAAATALLVGGPAAFDELVQAFGLDYAFLVDAKGDTRLTSGMVERLHWVGPGTAP